MKNGVPFDIAFALDGAEAMAFAIGFKEMAVAGHYDFEEGMWVDG